MGTASPRRIVLWDTYLATPERSVHISVGASSLLPCLVEAELLSVDSRTFPSKRDWSFVDSWNVFALATAKKWPLSPATSPASTRGECPSYSRGSSPNRIRQLSKNLCWPATARWPDVARTIVVDNCGRRSWCYGKITVPGPTLLVKHAADSLFLSLDQPHPSAGAGWRFALGPE